MQAARSRLSSQFNDADIGKRQKELKGFKKDQGLKEMRQIDNNNLKMFQRLTSVQPSVPKVVKRSITQISMNPSMSGDLPFDDYTTEDRQSAPQ